MNLTKKEKKLSRIKEVEKIITGKKYQRDKLALSKLTKKDLVSLIQSYNKCQEHFAISDYIDILNAVKRSGVDYSYEQQYVIVLNNFNVIIDIIKIDSLKKGTVDFEADVLFKKLLNIPHASRLAFLHNHPTGGTDPSETDKSMAKIIYILTSLMGFEFKDYIIFNSHELYSFMYDDPEYFNSLNKEVNDILNMKVLKDI